MIAPAVNLVLPKFQQYYIDENGEILNHNSDGVGIKIEVEITYNKLIFYCDKGRSYICYKYWL